MNAIENTHTKYESISIILYLSRLTYSLIQGRANEDLEIGNKNMKVIIGSAADEALCKWLKSTTKTKIEGLKIWNDELKTDIKDKKDAYLICIQDTKETKRNTNRIRRKET